MAAHVGEVITLQLGHYASNVGAQWWNLQSAAGAHVAQSGQHAEICSDVLFRRGVTLKGEETYTPRLILIDLKGSVSSVREEVSLYEDKNTARTAPAWKGNLTTHEEKPFIKTPALENPRNKGEILADEDFDERSLGDGVQEIPLPDCSRRPDQETAASVWSDYLRTALHPKSVCVVSPYNHSGGSEGLESYSQGEALLREASYLDEIEDRLHFFTEECDFLQGFQILCDLHSGFSGVGSRMAELLHDEYPGRGILSWGTSPVLSSERDITKDVFRLLNHFLGVVSLSRLSSLFCPLSLSSSLGRRPGPPVLLPHLLYDAESQYQSSAVLAVALDTLTAPYRKSDSPLSMGHLADALNFCGRKVVAASISLPFPLALSDCLADALLPHITSPPWSCLSASGGESGSFSQSVVLRGVCSERLISSLPAVTGPRSTLHAFGTGEDVLQCYLHTLHPRTVSLAHILQHTCSLGPTFPQIFSPYITKEGFTVQEPLRTSAAVHEVPVLASLQTAVSLHQTLRDLQSQARRVDIRRWPSFTAGLEHDDYQEALNELRSLAQCYREGNGTDEDSD